ncbi:MAG TPA: hypothetical protein DDW33_04680 [Ktedonobacter sp.]|nr:hypothetical protein [Ktedonobacter sp.]
MAISKLPEQVVAEDLLETPTRPFLLEQGLHFIQLGCYAEGLDLLTLACEHLPPDQVHLAELLDKFIQGSVEYQRVQQEFQKACARFVKAHSEQQACVAAFSSRLSLLKTSFCPPDHFPCQLKVAEEMNPQNAPIQPFMADQSTSPFPQPFMKEDATLPELFITCFGRFEVKRLGAPLALCSSRNGQRIFRYLVATAEHCATSDTLQAIFWPEDEPEVAQRKLHIAICALRRSLNSGYEHEAGSGYIVCKNSVYYLNKEITMHLDVDNFLHYFQQGQRTSEGRVAFYEQACSLYTGPFLPEDIYADWSFLQREQLSQKYLAMCRVLAHHYQKMNHYEEAARWATLILKEDHCDEAAHRQLIQVFKAQGRRSEAFKQYQRCERILRDELGVQPAPETVREFRTLVAGEPLPNQG